MQRTYQEATEKLEKSQTRLAKMTDLKGQLGKMQEAFAQGSASISDYAGLLSQLSSVSPTAAAAVEGLQSGALSSAEAFKILNQELDAFIEKENRISKMEFAKAMQNYQVPDNIKNLSKDLRDYSELMDVLATDYGVTKESSATERNKALYSMYSYGTLTDELLNGFKSLYGMSFEDAINKAMEQVGYDVGKMVQSEYGGMIMGRLWDIMLGEGADDEAVIKAEFDKQANLLVSVVNGTLEHAMSNIQTTKLKNMLFDKLAGPEGVLTSEELANLGDVFGQVLNQIMDQGVGKSPEWMDRAGEGIGNFVTGTIKGLKDLYKWADSVKAANPVEEIVDSMSG